MPRYIDADVLIKEINMNEDLSAYDVVIFEEVIINTPTADVVEIVRCGECKYLMPGGKCSEFADDNIRPSASDFCSAGERREDETVH